MASSPRPQDPFTGSGPRKDDIESSSEAFEDAPKAAEVLITADMSASSVTSTPRSAWLQVLLSHLININTFGTTLSFGIFQPYYVSTLSLPPSTIAWIGTTQLFLIFALAPLSGRLLDAGYHRPTLLLGLTLQTVSHLSASFTTTHFPTLFLTQGLLMGLGNGLLFCPAVALVASHFSFSPNRTLALSLVASGGGTGGILFPALASSLLPQIGAPWTLRAMAAVMLLIAALTGPFSRPPPLARPAAKQPLLDITALRSPAFALFCAGTFLAFLGLYSGYWFARAYASTLGASQASTFHILLLVNAAGIPGRILPALLADRLGSALGVQIPTVAATGIVFAAWAGVRSMPGFWAWAAVYGFLAGACQALFQASSTAFGGGGARLGVVCAVVSFAGLAGGPVGGALIGKGGYGGMGGFCGGVMLLGAGMLGRAKWMLGRKTRREGSGDGV